MDYSSCERVWDGRKWPIRRSRPSGVAKIITFWPGLLQFHKCFKINDRIWPNCRGFLATLNAALVSEFLAVNPRRKFPAQDSEYLLMAQGL